MQKDWTVELTVNLWRTQQVQSWPFFFFLFFLFFLWRKQQQQQQQQRNNSSWWRRTKQLGIKRLFELYLMKVDAVHVGHRAWSKQKAQSTGVYFCILFPSKQFWRAQMDAGVNWADHRLNSQYHDILSIHGRKQNRKRVKTKKQKIKNKKFEVSEKC